MPTCRKTILLPTIPDGGYRWNDDLCHTALFEPGVRADDQNFAYPQSLHPVRAVEVDLENTRDEDALAGIAPGEMCAYHWGYTGIGTDGFVESYLCSQPGRARDLNQVSLLNHVIQKVGPEIDEADADVNIDDGFAGMWGVYHAVYWTEAQFHSAIQRCGAPL